MKVFIITEGSKSTGYGHLTRCLSLYQAFEEKDVIPTFIATIDEYGKKFLSNTNLDAYQWLENKGKLFEQIVGSDIVVIDSYLAKKEVYDKIAETVKKVVYLDDYIRIDYPKGVVINGTIGAEELPYKKDDNHQYLLGIYFIPLRKEFWDIELRVRKNEKKNILITFGGQDIRNLTFTILDSLLEHFNSYNYHVVLGVNNKTKNLNKYKNNNVDIYSSLNTEEMLQLMLKCDLAVSAAGQTIYELARVGLPTVGIGVADNQKYNIKGWVKKGFMKKEIWYYQDNFIEQVNHSIKEILKQNKIEDSAYCDGQGARRIVSTIIDNRINLMTNIVLREATFNDAKRIYNLSNEEEVRRNSINNKPIEWNTHLQWLKSKLDDNNYKILLSFIEDNFIGQVKFEIQPPSAIISISIHRDFRGKGLSCNVLKKAIEYFLAENTIINNIIALIRPENKSSIKSFNRAGFFYIDNEIINQELFLKYKYYRRKYDNRKA